ncbi:MAG: NAD(P)H-hydrate epimerase [Pseudomonadota bacterium]
MLEPIRAEEMRAVEKAAIDSGQVTGLELMERAGQGVVEAIFAEWPELADAKPKYAAVIAGPGNNGGDGFVIARLLRDAGWFVDLSALGTPETYSPDAKAMLDALEERPYFVPQEDVWRLGGAIYETESHLIVDAVFGIGLNKPLGDDLQEALCGDLRLFRDEDLGTKCVSVDIPSGLDADTGEIVGGEKGDAFRAHLTVTFHAPKIGHVTGQGPEICGKVVVKDIGL